MPTQHLSLVLSLPLLSLCAGIDRLIEPLCAAPPMQAKVKANAVKQEHEKQEELKRSSLRAVAALLTIPDSSECSRGRGEGGREGRESKEVRGREGGERHWVRQCPELPFPPIAVCCEWRPDCCCS